MEWDVHIEYLSSKRDKCYYIIKSLKGIKVQIPSGACLSKLPFTFEVRQPLFFFWWWWWWGDGKSKTIFNLQKKAI
jgi:hypothetical protein